MSTIIDHYDDLVKAEYIGVHKIRCTFKNGKAGTIDMKPYCEKGGVFSYFSDLDNFKNFYIDNGVLTWNDGEVDIAPETLYHKATGEPYPQGMTA